ncbi:MAG: glycosyltransferase family 4 protein [Bacillota bacterium]
MKQRHVIDIDARMLGFSGIGVYLENLVREMAVQSTQYTFNLFGNLAKLTLFSEPNIIKNSLDAPVYGLKEQLVINRVFAKTDSSLLHCPHYNIPLLYKGKLVVTVHDLIHLKFPQYLPNKTAYLYARLMIGSAVKKADKVIAVSENTKRDIVDWFSVNPDKVEVIYNGFAGNSCSGVSPEEAQKIRAGLGINKPYILYVGNVRPHKNIQRLIGAFIQLESRFGNEFQLVIAGDIRKDFNPFFIDGQKMNSSNIILTGWLPRRDLTGLYEGAGLFVFPSLYEGFGFPPLEAMACGVPVVASNVSSIPEVVGEAAIMADPYDIEDLSQAMEKGLTDEPVRAALVEKGYRQVTKFSWRQTAGRVLRLYDEVLN